MGDISVRNKNPESAFEAYREAYASNPQDKVVLMKLATLTQTYFPEMVDDSIDYYTQLLELQPEDSAFIYYELGHLYLKKRTKSIQ